MTKSVNILGIRGLPPKHGGFETFVGRLAPHLVEQGFQVNVFSQVDDAAAAPSTWRGVNLINLESGNGPLGTILFDLHATFKAAALGGPALVFGYNTAVLNVLLLARRIRFAINMDGIEWRRRKWNAPVKLWFYLNEGFAALTAPILIADHPAIARHLHRRNRRARIETIPYGATPIREPHVHGILAELRVERDRFATIIARPEPENSILEMVEAFSHRPRDGKLVVLGRYSSDHPYQRQVLDAASDQVIFAGPIYDSDAVEALRSNSSCYLYGHTVGGTSPTLVEALAAGTTPLCLDSVYARWVAGDAGRYFSSREECSRAIDLLFAQSGPEREISRAASLRRFEEEFTWDSVLGRYESLIERLET